MTNRANYTGDNTWSPEMCDRLRELWPTDLSTAQIGAQIGVTKSAVTGKARRLNLPQRLNPIQHQKIYHPKKLRVPKPARVRKRKPIPAPPTPAAAPTPLLIGTDQLTPHTCRFPIGHPSDRGFGFCGQPTALRSYCQFHHDLTHTEPVHREENKRPKSDAQRRAEKINIEAF